jgi:phage gp37-like protein
MFRVDEIEDAILATLKSDSVLAAFVRAFSALPGMDEKTLGTIFPLFPAVGVMALRGTYDYALNGVQDETGVFAILCINRNLRSSVAALRGGTASDKGIWDMIEDCRRAILASPSLGLDTVQCLATGRNLVCTGENFAAASLETEARWRHR